MSSPTSSILITPYVSTPCVDSQLLFEHHQQSRPFNQKRHRHLPWAWHHLRYKSTRGSQSPTQLSRQEPSILSSALYLLLED
ncbi:hypothetical protein SCUP515_09605 [Seiridium cupressi]